MKLSWTGPVAAAFRDAYLDWSWLLQERRAGLLPPPPHVPDWFQPIFVRLKPSGTPPDIETTRKTVIERAASPLDPLLMDPQEYDRLAARVRDPGFLEGLPDEYALYLRRGTPSRDIASLMEVIDTGFPVDIDTRDAPQRIDPDACADPDAPAIADPQSRPIVAIIDDGIGFLNARFRKPAAGGRYRTRFHAVWLQALESRRRDGPRRAHVGEILTRADIDAWLSRGEALEEAAVYSALGQRLYGHEGHKSLQYGISHGTHVLDLAAGADPQGPPDPVHDWPLIGVQLPSEAVADTSGMRFEAYMVQGVRWILAEAARIDPAAPVIVNLSLGMLAGPKDGSSFAEYQIAREAALWEKVTGQPVRVVWAFGNNRRSRQVARLDFDPEVEVTRHRIAWRNQPDDLTASYMEIRTPDGIPSDRIEISLTTPGGVDSGFVPIPVGGYRTLAANGAPVARIYHVPAHRLSASVTQRSTHTLALAPNAAQVAGEPLAEAGVWQVGVRCLGAVPCAVHLQIQRDEALPGYRNVGRQSYFDGDDAAYAWDSARQDWSGLTPTCPITRAATHSALVTDPARQVFSVGAALWQAAREEYAPAPYSPDGSGWSVPGPTAATRADDGWAQRGVLAAGTYTGSTSPISGTSAAAGRMTRALAMNARRIARNAARGGGSQMQDLDGGAVPLRPVAPGEAGRLGAAIAEPGGATDRSGGRPCT